MPETFSCDLRASLLNVQHLQKRRCYKITLEVPADIGARIMDYAAMLAGLQAWDESKVLDGGLLLTERGPGLAEHGCEGCGDDSRVCGC